MKRRFKIIVEKTEEGYVSYPIGLRGVVVSDGDTFEEAIAFHIQTFSAEGLGEPVSLDRIFVTETEVTVDA